ncbi:hypothetical protein [Novipirellula caenicola]|uniref:hypothetical protein n=1 Tax=Novipirellula caenicola TaxID=1536901 RepID=UPI0031EC231D
MSPLITVGSESSISIITSSSAPSFALTIGGAANISYGVNVVTTNSHADNEQSTVFIIVVS